MCCVHNYSPKRRGRSWAGEREERACRGYGCVAVHFSPEVCLGHRFSAVFSSQKLPLDGAVETICSHGIDLQGAQPRRLLREE